MLTYQQAISGPDKQKWSEALEDEKESLMRNGTWGYVDKTLAQGKQVLTGVNSKIRSTI